MLSWPRAAAKRDADAAFRLQDVYYAQGVFEGSALVRVNPTTLQPFGHLLRLGDSVTSRSLCRTAARSHSEAPTSASSCSCEQRETRRWIVARGRDLHLSPGEQVSVFAHRRLENGSSGITESSGHAEVSVELVCVFPAERRDVLLQPFEERDSPERRLLRDQQPSGQAADLVRGEHDVAHNDAERVR